MALLPTNLGSLAIVEVFEEHDFPCLFVCQSDGGKQYLAVWIAETKDRNDWLYTEISPGRLEQLRTGEVKLREAYTKAEAETVLRISVPKSVGDSISIGLTKAQLSDDILPSATATLVGDLAPAHPLRRAAEIEAQILGLPNAVAEAMGLAQELNLAKFLESNSDGQIAFDGGPVTGHEVEAGFFGKFWDRFQSLFDVTARAVFGDAVGPSETKLLLGMTSSSSYAIGLRLPAASENDAAELFASPSGEARARRVFDLVASMLIDEVPPRETVDIINHFQSVRTQFGGVLELIWKAAATIVLRTRRDRPGDSLPIVRPESG